MKITRKEFLKISGACLVAFTGKKALAVLDNPAKSQTSSASGSKASKQLGMVVDTRKCIKDQGCTKCIDACVQAHNIPSFKDPHHQIKWIWKKPFDDLFSSYETEYLETSLKDEQTPVLCNHCDKPPCVRVCPTGATWKRKEDGIVMMDWHRCIGCRFCMAACPYGARSFNWVDPRPDIKTLNPNFPTRTKGVVEKCTFCSERLVKGEMPACVEACPEKALVFGDVNDPKSEIRQLLAKSYTLRRRPELGTGPNIYYLV
ncbi:MAG: 4Fe-4S dicluster domain-containing protein [Acidobacteriota bacterium]